MTWGLMWLWHTLIVAPWCLFWHLNLNRLPYDQNLQAWVCEQHGIVWRP